MSRLAGEIFSFLVIALLLYALIYTRVRQRRNRESNAWVQNQPVIYDCAVLVRQCMHPGGNWVDWSRSLGGGPRLLIRAGAIEVRASQGMMLNSRDICLRADTARMWRDEVGWLGVPLVAASASTWSVATRPPRSSSRSARSPTSRKYGPLSAGPG
jgi:hypothetical protein